MKVNWVNPNSLGSLQTYTRKFMTPIANSGPENKKLGLERLAELTCITQDFILRRTNDINSKYLPPKTEMILFVTMSDIQKKLYLETIEDINDAEGSNIFASLGTLRNIANSPSLSEKGGDVSSMFNSCI